VAVERWLGTLELVEDARLLRGRFAASCYAPGARSSWFIRDKSSHLERAEMIGSIQRILCSLLAA
jgi:hypothetical protein